MSEVQVCVDETYEEGEGVTKRPARKGDSAAKVALQSIAAREGCGHSTTGPGACWSERPNGRFAKFSSDSWCDGCIALDALHDLLVRNKHDRK